LLNIGPDEVLVFYAGQYRDVKGIEELLAVQPALIAAQPKLVFAWAGDGTLREAARPVARAAYLMPHTAKSRIG
jgi:diacylglycerol kinase family enzyme